MTRRLALVVGIVLVAVAFAFAPPPVEIATRRATGPTQRLLGPLSSVAASVEWVRYSLALAEGDEQRAFVHARRGLALDPRSASGWSTLASHFIFLRGSPSETPTEAERKQWFKAGFDVFDEGMSRAESPRDLAFESGLVAHYFATLPPGRRPWTGSRPELLERAVVDLARAARLRHPGAEALLAKARIALSDSR